MTEANKKRSKGGFLHLFDWNAKSRKNLFANNQELDGEAKKGKENVGTTAKSLIQVIEVEESQASSSNKGSGEFTHASSVTSEGYGSGARGLVARLMGLDSLPTSNVPEPCSTPYSDLASMRTSNYDRSIPNLRSENHPVDYHKIPSKEWFYRNQVESRAAHKVQNRPIEKFQTEMLPPKSAKSIPITHHKLLSPIKTHRFVPTRNAAYIVEAAAKIIEASPQTDTKGKRASIVDSVPSRIWDMKEKMETTHRVSRPQKSNKSIASKYMKGQHLDQRHWDLDSTTARASVSSEKRSPVDMTKKGKSVSMTVQAKASVQRSGGTPSISSSSKSLMNQKEKNGVKANQFCKNQPDTQRSAQKGTSTNRATNVLGQNNQKQNYTFNKDRSNLKTTVLNQQGKKSKSTSGSVRQNKAVNKAVVNSETGSKKIGLTTNSAKKELLSSKVKKSSRKKLSANGDSPSEESIADNEMKKDEKTVKCNTAIEGSMNWGMDNRKNGMDVVSFTFSSPIRSRPDPESSGQVIGKNNRFNIDCFGDDNQLCLKNSMLSTTGLNIINGGDALSVLLEHKLMELTRKIESSNCNVIGEGNSDIAASGLQDSVPTHGGVIVEEGQRFRACLNSCSSASDSLPFSINPKWQFQQSGEMERHNSGTNNNENGRVFDCEHSSRVSSLEHSYTNANCSDSRDSTNDSEAESTSLTTDASLDCETEFSDSASSISVGLTSKKHMTRTFSLVDVTESSNWEFNYLSELLDKAVLTMNEFALGQANQAMTPSLFNQLENLETKMGIITNENSKLQRKVLFDFVYECLDLKCKQFFVGSWKAWAKWVILFQRKGWLAEELYKEVHCWKSARDLMVDELVDKDMSSQVGKWLDYDIEAFEEGVEIESNILTSLVDELVSDFLLY